MTKQELSDQIRIFYEATRIPLSLFSSRELILNYTHEVQDFSLPLLLFDSIQEELPAVWYSFTPEYVYFGGIRLDREHTLFLGPAMLSECTDMQAAALRRRLGRKPADTVAVRQYFTLTGPHNLTSLKANLILLCRLFRMTEPAPDEIPLLSFTWRLPYKARLSFPVSVRQETSDSLEASLVSCISSGNIQAMNRLLSETVSASPAALQLPLESMRSFILGANMLASRTALSAGLNYSTVTSMHGQYVIQILQARTPSELSALFFRFFQDFTEKVAELKSLPSDSPVVKFIQQYVTSHYADRITPHLLAEKLKMSCPYLCSHFKKETGITIGTYIRQEKIREAKRLLTGSSYTVSEISEALAFSSESYFLLSVQKNNRHDS